MNTRAPTEKEESARELSSQVNVISAPLSPHRPHLDVLRWPLDHARRQRLAAAQGLSRSRPARVGEVQRREVPASRMRAQVDVRRGRVSRRHPGAGSCGASRAAKLRSGVRRDAVLARRERRSKAHREREAKEEGGMTMSWILTAVALGLLGFNVFRLQWRIGDLEDEVQRVHRRVDECMRLLP